MTQSSWLQECFAQGSSPESPAPRSREPCDLATGPPLTNKGGITVRDPLLLMIMIMIAAAAAPSACMAVQREHNIGQGGGGGTRGKHVHASGGELLLLARRVKETPINESAYSLTHIQGRASLGLFSSPLPLT